MKKIFELLLTVVVLSTLVACSSATAVVTEPADTEMVATEPEETEAAETEPEETEVVETTEPETRIVTGDDGTEVEIDYTITKAAPIIGAFAQMTEMLTAGGGKIVAGATAQISDYFKQVFPDYVESNPNNYDARTIEDLIAAGAQVAYGPASIFSEDQVDQLKQAGCAFVPISNIGTVEGICNAFLIIGEILGPEEYARAQEFVEYYQGNIDLAKEHTSALEESDKVTFLSLFYSESAYTTINSNDISNEYILAAGGVNVAADYGIDTQGSNSLAVDAEQIVAWNPQFIMTSTQAGKDAILADPALATVDAVKNGNVAVCPYGIYLWSVRSGEGSMLSLWMGVQMYPDLFSDIDMANVVKSFFNDWYNYDISDEEIDNVLAGNSGS